jgi:ketosteroid isomerase-like protein
MSERAEAIRRAFAALDRGGVEEFERLFADGAQWLGVPGSGVEGTTPI